MRFYDVDSGSILLSGHDVADYSRASTRSRFGMVLQDTWLFGGTIAENVAFGKPDATREEIIQMCIRDRVWSSVMWISPTSRIPSSSGI